MKFNYIKAGFLGINILLCAESPVLLQAKIPAEAAGLPQHVQEVIEHLFDLMDVNKPLTVNPKQLCEKILVLLQKDPSCCNSCAILQNVRNITEAQQFMKAMEQVFDSLPASIQTIMRKKVDGLSAGDKLKLKLKIIRALK